MHYFGRGNMTGNNPDFSHVQSCELTQESKTIFKRKNLKRLKKVVYRTNTTGEIMHISLAVALFPLLCLSYTQPFKKIPFKNSFTFLC